MNLLLLRSWWTGPTDLALLIQQTLNDGFEGIEGPIPKDKQERQRLYRLLQENNLVFIAEATTGSDPNSFKDWWIPRLERTIDDHLEDLKWVIDHAHEVGALFVSTMCGYDAWSWQQNVDFFGRALELEKSSGITVSFETHRSRSLYNPWTTRDLLNEYPTMKLTCDFSHWCVVCERLIDTEWAILELCAERAQHIQCRVGYPQHAQVPDPRADEYKDALTAHERWWSLIWEKQRQRGMSRTTMMPEFLYDGYMQTLPYTGMPVADVWEITCWMAQRQRQRFANR
ncbi:MAG: sugar phosphate isomerase/epimerase [Leptolyngbya sp. SIO3F4]|nr:sugar phosphate isomerase/epimerase [Leptolyngbya sp. SIO3F4]